MIRITLRTADNEVVLKPEGMLSAEWVRELETAWLEARHAAQRRTVRVDLRGVCRIDAHGRALLGRMHEGGAEFMTSGFELPEIVREIASTAPAALVERI
jgi:ABC-type transporter Mla MlaB component